MAWYRRFVVCWESFVPGGSIGAACWESFIPVWPAGVSCGESFVPVVHLTCGAGGVLSRSSGETARSEGGARPAGPGRASRRRAERSSRRGRRAGGQASRRTGGLAGCAERSSLGWRLRCRWSWSPDRRGCEACGGCICGAEGRRPDRRVVRGLQGLAGLRGDAPSEARGVDGERAGRPRAARRSGRVRDRAPVTGYCAGS